MSDNPTAIDPLPFDHHCFTDVKAERERLTIETWSKRFLGLRYDLAPHFLMMTVNAPSVIGSALIFVLAIQFAPHAPAWMFLTSPLLGVLAAFLWKVREWGWPKYNFAQEEALEDRKSVV